MCNKYTIYNIFKITARQIFIIPTDDLSVIKIIFVQLKNESFSTFIK